MLPVPTKPKLKQKSTRRDLEELKFSGSHARMIERRRNSGQISCAECRRLRIKCNKQIPCQSCRHSCTTVTTNTFTRIHSEGVAQHYVPMEAFTQVKELATEHLHRRVSRMSERIWQLEDALSELQARYSTEPHPLLRPDLLGASQHDNVSLPCANNPEVAEPTSELVESLGTLSISDGGASRFFGPTGGSHCLLMSDNLSSQEFAGGSSDSARDSTGPELPHAIEKFTLPLLFKPFHSTLNVENLVSDYLPTWEQAHRLVEAYLEEATWLFHNVSKDQILFELLPAYYVNNIPHVAQADSNPHRLCLLFLIFAIGALLDASQKPGNAEAEHYHQVARVAICLQSVMEKPSLETIQALYLLSAYNVMSGNELAGKETSMETSWSLVTLAAHLAHTLGLRDGWYFGIYLWQMFGTVSKLGDLQPSLFHTSIASFLEAGHHSDKVHIGSDNCVADVAARTLTYDFPSYFTVLELDRKVRNFPVTEAAEEFVAAASGAVPAKPTDRGIGMMESMDRFVMSNAREVTYRASLTVLHTIKVQYGLHPKLTARFWLIWTFAFSAAIVFGTVVTRGPRSPMASDAMKELRDACILFSKASSHSRRAQKALPIITKLTEKAHNALLHARSDMPNELGQQWGVTKNKGDDELAIFAGRMKFVSIRRQTTDGTSERCTNADRSVEWSNSPAPESQQEQNQVELALPQSYGREQLDPVWPHWQPGSAADPKHMEEIPTGSTLMELPPALLQIYPDVARGVVLPGLELMQFPIEIRHELLGPQFLGSQESA
ncbi:hypothetical protein F5J12DRAFT_786194 [Pisolithus orientalis]|uniref:uncharacterized protein n=1 Tax=Pisolithus orientalis TaxID=936130 RepID=UPI0022252702|nr:uncharacterized protein F5J12DRAFT_786194 [Pisolithus orientalis]KAI5992291.1 hypothetical protein F5J12DRAFT_786194 [Pisolithus orientalis]